MIKILDNNSPAVAFLSERSKEDIKQQRTEECMIIQQYILLLVC